MFTVRIKNIYLRVPDFPFKFSMTPKTAQKEGPFRSETGAVGFILFFILNLKWWMDIIHSHFSTQTVSSVQRENTVLLGQQLAKQ